MKLWIHEHMKRSFTSAALQVLSSEWYRRCSRLSIYVSTFGEADTTSIIRESILNGKQVFIPNFQRGSNKMDMLRVASEDEFENLGAVLWGIRQHTHPCDELSWRHSGISPFFEFLISCVPFLWYLDFECFFSVLRLLILDLHVVLC